MSTSIQPARPLAGLKQALRECRAERQHNRHYAIQSISQSSAEPPPPPPPRVYPSLMPKLAFNNPAKGFRPSQTIKQNRFDDGLRRIPTIPPPRSTLKLCKDPLSKVYEDQLKLLDPSGARTRLFAQSNPERVQPGDILLVRLKDGDDFSGVCLNIRQRNSPIDTAILLRNHLTRIPVEMWYKVYSPNVDGIEIVQRKEKRARRAKLHYMRHPKHDLGSVDGIVRQYHRQRMGTSMGGKGAKGRDANSHRKKNNKQGAKGAKK